MKLTTHNSLLKSHKGQSLIEVLIAMAVSVVLLGAAAQLFVTSFTIDTRSKDIQNATLLAQELLRDVVARAEDSWNTIYNTQKDETQYYLDASSTPAVGATTTVRADKTFTMYFTVDNVSRDVDDDIEDPYDPGNDDPQTQKITAHVLYSVIGAGQTKDISFVQYVTSSYCRIGAADSFTIPIGKDMQFIFDDIEKYQNGISGSDYRSIIAVHAASDIPLTVAAGQAVNIIDPDMKINADSIGVQAIDSPIATSTSVTVPSSTQSYLSFYVGVPDSPGAESLLDQDLSFGIYSSDVTVSDGNCTETIQVSIDLCNILREGWPICPDESGFYISSGEEVEFVFNEIPKYQNGISGAFYHSIIDNYSTEDIPLTITVGQAVDINDPDNKADANSIGVQVDGGSVVTSASATVSSGEQLTLYFYAGVPDSPPGSIPFITQDLSLGIYAADVTVSDGTHTKTIQILITLQ